MKDFLRRLSIVLLLLLTLFIILTGVYIADPDFKEWVNSHLPGVKVVKPVTVSTTGTYPVDTSGDTHAYESGVVDPVSDGSVSPADNDLYNTAGTGETGDFSGYPGVDPGDVTRYLSDAIDTRYVAPDELTLMIPEDMLERVGGYITITLDTETLPDAEAQRVESELGYGETGDGLDFDPLMYPYYAMLDDQSKHLYRQIYANANAMIDDFRAVESDVTPTQLRSAFMAVFYDHPELFWLDTRFSAGFRGNGDCLELKLYFNSLANDVDNIRGQFDAAAASLANSASTPYDIEKNIHAALSHNNVYSLAAPYNQSAYSALMGGSTVCAGYSRAFQYACQLAGIPCYYCAGYAGESHAWNIICLDGEFYNVDVTWDDTDRSPEYNYDWFNKSDADYGTTHVRRDLSVYLPPCNGSKYSNLESAPAAEQPAPVQDQPPVEEQPAGGPVEQNPADYFVIYNVVPNTP